MFNSPPRTPRQNNLFTEKLYYKTKSFCTRLVLVNFVNNLRKVVFTEGVFICMLMGRRPGPVNYETLLCVKISRIRKIVVLCWAQNFFFFFPIILFGFCDVLSDSCFIVRVCSCLCHWWENGWITWKWYKHMQSALWVIEREGGMGWGGVEWDIRCFT